MQMRPAPLASRNWDAILAVSIAAVCAWVYCRSFLTLPGALPGFRELPVDGAHQHFIFAQVTGWLLQRWSLVFTDHLWFPVGYPFLLWHQNIVDAALAAPLELISGSIRGISLFSFFMLLTNGLAGAWLARTVAGRGWATVAGAVVLGCSPFVLGELEFGRGTQAWLVPSAVAVGLAWEAGRGWRRAVLAGVGLALSGYHFWPYGAFTAFIVAGVVLGREQLLPGLRTLSIIGGVAALLTAPFVLFVARSWVEMPGSQLAVPRFNVRANLLGGLPGDPRARGDNQYLPQLLLPAALLALVSGPSRRAALAMTLAAVWLITLAMGDSIQVGGTRYLLPFALLKHLPGLSRFWWPYRALGPATVALVPLLALLFSRLKGVTLAVGLAGLGLCFAQTLWAPGPVHAVEAPPLGRWYKALPPGAVLFIPMLEVQLGKTVVFQQPLHGRPLVNGISMWERHMWSPAYTRFFNGQPLLSALMRLEQGDRAEAGPESVGQLARTGVVAILTRADSLSSTSPQVSGPIQLLRSLVGEPVCLEGDPYCFWRLTGATTP